MSGIEDAGLGYLDDIKAVMAAAEVSEARATAIIARLAGDANGSRLLITYEKWATLDIALDIASERLANWRRYVRLCGGDGEDAESYIAAIEAGDFSTPDELRARIEQEREGGS